ncbi:MAG: 23S rRNA (uridine(2552)-2'-O)-methyltransferase RlmE [Candidatus Dasytiphilus stammeri]
MYPKKFFSSRSWWLQEHLNDKYVKQAKTLGVRSRAWFKLDEIQKCDKLLQPNMSVIDLGAAPGSWSQYAIQHIGLKGQVIACDILPITPIKDVNFVQGDCTNEYVRQQLFRMIKNQNKVQLIMSDMSPNISGIYIADVHRMIFLAKMALKICNIALDFNGGFLVKMFYGEGFDEYLQNIRTLFKKVRTRKPEASRTRSSEVYIVATGFKKHSHIY